jgi:FMN phosphatase YigB (HAD superfamily)
MKLILDFDDVLLNAKGLKQVMCDILREEGVENGEELYEEERKSGRAFIPKEFLQRSCLASRGESFVAVDVDMMYEKMLDACAYLVNQELVTLIKKVGKDNCFIVSNGNQEFQENKIQRSGLDVLVKKIVIVSGTKSLEIEQICAEFPQDSILFIDDKSINFNDINLNMCKNLKMILYKGKESLAEVEDEIHKAQMVENQKVMVGGPAMR